MVVVRRAAMDDAQDVSRLVDALLMELGGSNSRYDERLVITRHLMTLSDRVFGFLAFDHHEPIGVIMMSESASIYAGGMFGVITELYVRPDRRSSGVATMLIEAGTQIGRDLRWSRLEVTAPRQPIWQRSLKFYLRVGFLDVGPRLQFDL
jgi:GNAT superfamily N-acetyltransferase